MAARINLSVPDDLKAEMDSIESVNWSSVASDAFRRVVQQQKQWGSTMSDAVNRMRASKERFEKDMQERGEADGRQWVLEAAEYETAKSVAEFEFRDFDRGELRSAVEDEIDGDWDAFLAEVVGDDADRQERLFGNGAYVRGFVDGVKEAFEEIERQL